MKNAIINGNFNIWQRGTSWNDIPATEAYYADRFYIIPSGTTTDVDRGTFSSPDSNAKYSLQIHRDTVTETLDIGQRIESANIRPFKKTVTFSFWIHNGMGESFIPSLVLTTPAVNPDDYTAAVTEIIDETLGTAIKDAWTKMTFTTDISQYPHINNGLQMVIHIPGVVSGLGSKQIDISEVQLEAGSSATDFEYRPVGEELALCQRYYEKSYSIGTAPGTPSTVKGAYAGSGLMTATTTGDYLCINFTTAKRTEAYTMTAYNQSTGATNSWVISNAGGTTTVAPTFYAESTQRCGAYKSNISTTTIGYGVSFFGQWTCDDEL